MSACSGRFRKKGDTMPKFKEGDKVAIISKRERGEVIGPVTRLPLMMPGEKEEQVQYV
jgi:Cu/Ag efflux protein CusF